MHTKIQEILKKIESLNDDLRREYERLSEKYGFSAQRRKIVFLEEFRKRNASFRLSSWSYVIGAQIRHILSMPFIYGMIIPILILDVFITIYQFFAFPLYRIPKVKRSDYIIYDRRFLDYLNWIQKIHCLYCSYVNGMLAYSVEIAARTERYWCPIKAASKPKFSHGWYGDFSDYGNPEEWKEKYGDREGAFRDVYGDKCFVGK